MTDILKTFSHWELLEIEKAARYLGGEVNQTPIKDNPLLKVCIAFPDLYELGMSNLAIKIFYELLNKNSKIMAERVFAPWTDFEALLRRKNVPLSSLETGTPLNEFDVLAITFPYEMTFTNIINMLELGGVSLEWKTRDEGPLVIAGGPSAANPLPMAKFIDAFVIGDGEEAMPEICELVMATQKDNLSKSETRQKLSQIEGVWVPEYPQKMKRRVFQGFKTAQPPIMPVVPNVQAIHNRAPIEIFRGCVQGCRFCNAGYYYRPKREREVSQVIKWSRELLKNTGEESLGLLSLSTSDYSQLNELLTNLEETKAFDEQTVSIPSMRMNENTLELLENTPHIRKGGLTFAPEAGTQKLRNVINKNITEEDILKVIDASKGSSYRSLKLYFMMGLPFETDEDLEGIVTLVEKIDAIAKRQQPRKKITISLSGFIPKPFTPFQWAEQASIDELKRKRQIVRRGIQHLKVKLSWRDEYLCMLESVLSRGDEKIAEVIVNAHKFGAKFDGWDEHFNRNAWEQAFEEADVDPNDYLKERVVSDELPWDFVDFRVPRSFLEQELIKAKQAAVTPNTEDLVQADNNE